MIHLFEAPNLYLLAKKLADDLKDQSVQIDPFCQDWIVVQNKETRVWLQSEISQINGVSANVRFIYPFELAWQIIRLYRNDISNELPTDRIAIQSRIFDFIYSNKSELNKHGLIVPDDITTTLNLADSISDVFDLYQVYRPEILQKWNKTIEAGSNYLAWQSLIWNRISRQITTEFNDLPGRWELNYLINDFLKTDIEPIPRRASVLGLSHWSKSFFSTIHILSKHIDIHWYDQSLLTQSENARFKAWAKPKSEVKEFFDLFDIVRSNNSALQIGNSESNTSIMVHSCHNAEREVQVLKNELLSYLDRNPESKVNDILIMVPDFEKYAPIVENEFNTEGAFPSIPVFVPSISANSVDDFLLRLLGFYIENEKVTDFIELLSHNYLKSIFDVNEVEISFYSQAFAEMNIHRALKAEDSEFSIEKGVDQLLLSYLMASNNYEVFQNYALIDMHAGSDVKTYIYKLAEIYRKLGALKAKIQKEYTLLGWVKVLDNWLKGLAPNGPIIIKSIEGFIKRLELSNPSTVVNFDTFYTWISSHLVDQPASSTPVGSGVTVSSYIPYRNIPFKYVAILGLNEGVFPRSNFRSDFDLVHLNPKPGDRIAKLDDSLLFLERIKSTSDHVHLSYIGEGEQGAMPSTLIQELEDDLPDLKTVHHKLHGFSQSKSNIVSVYPSMETELTSLIQRDSIPNNSTFEGKFQHEIKEIINLNNLIEYFAHPSKYLLTNILASKNIFEQKPVANREPFVLSGLDKYLLKQELVGFNDQSFDVDRFKSFGKSRGLIPRGSTGSVQFDKQKGLIDLITERIETLISVEEKCLDVILSIGSKKVKGLISSIYGNDRVIWRITETKSRDIIQLWINHLFLSHISPTFQRSLLISIDKKGTIKQQVFERTHNALSIIEAYLGVFNTEWVSRDHFSCIPGLGHSYMLHYGDSQKQLKELAKAWYSVGYTFKEDSDYFNSTLWHEELPWNNDRFKYLSEILWRPIVEHIQESDI